MSPLPDDYQTALREAGPGTVVAISLEHRTALLIVEERETLRRWAGSPFDLALLRQEVFFKKGGTAVRLTATCFLEPPFTAEAFLNPGSLADRPLLESLATQEVLEFYFYSPDDLSRPFRVEQAEWNQPLRDEAARILRQIAGPPSRQSTESFLTAKEAVMRENPLLPPAEKLAKGVAQWLPSAWQQDSSAHGQNVTKFVWGLPPDGPMIFFVTPLPTAGAVSADVVAEAQWFPVSREDRDSLAGGASKWQGVTAALPPFDEEGYASSTLSLLWPQRQNPVEALRTIAEQAAAKGELIPWPIIGGLYAALQARGTQLPPVQWQNVCRGLLLSILDRPFSEIAPAPVMPRKDMHEAVVHWAQAPKGWLPANAYSRAQFLWELGRLAWSTDIKFEVAAQESGVPVTMLAAYTYMYAQHRPLQVSIPGVGVLRAEDDHIDTIFQLWRTFQFLATLAAGHMLSREACAFILPGQQVRVSGSYPIVPPAVVREALPAPASLPAPEYLRAWAAEIEREAAEQQAIEQRVYVPLGGFIVPVPPDTLLHDWGVQELRVYADPNGLWASIVTPDRRAVLPFRWQQPEKRTIPAPDLMHLVPSWAQPSLQFFCAALWRDLRSVGAAGFPRSSPKDRGTPSQDKPVDKGFPTPRRHGGAPIRVLPRHRSAPAGVPWQLQGERRIWGTPDEQRVIRRRASITAGHFRAWLYIDEAKANALQAAGETPPTETWRERRRQDRHQGNEDKALFWETLLQAAGTAGREVREIDRLLLVESVLAGAQRQHADKPRLLHWLGAALRVVDEAKQEGAGDVLNRCLENLECHRSQAGARAAQWGVPAPPVGFTFVQPFTSGGRSPEEETAAPVVRAKGLLVVELVLRRPDTEAAPDAAGEDEVG